jgi:uncharacterized protein YcbK (DUF882 family)
VIDWRQFANFSRPEFICKCGCGRVDMDAKFLHALQSLRTQLGFRFKISSGWRCPDYNATVSTTGWTGPHTTGAAADILVYHDRAERIMSNAAVYGFKGFGANQKGHHAKRFIHLDTAREAIRFWTY